MNNVIAGIGVGLCIKKKKNCTKCQQRRVALCCMGFNASAMVPRYKLYINLLFLSTFHVP